MKLFARVDLRRLSSEAKMKNFASILCDTCRIKRLGKANRIDLLDNVTASEHSKQCLFEFRSLRKLHAPSIQSHVQSGSSRSLFILYRNPKNPLVGIGGGEFRLHCPAKGSVRHMGTCRLPYCSDSGKLLDKERIVSSSDGLIKRVLSVEKDHVTVDLEARTVLLSASAESYVSTAGHYTYIADEARPLIKQYVKKCVDLGRLIPGYFPSADHILVCRNRMQPVAVYENHAKPPLGGEGDLMAEAMKSVYECFNSNLTFKFEETIQNRQPGQPGNILGLPGDKDMLLQGFVEATGDNFLQKYAMRYPIFWTTQQMARYLTEMFDMMHHVADHGLIANWDLSHFGNYLGIDLSTDLQLRKAVLTFATFMKLSPHLSPKGWPTAQTQNWDQAQRNTRTDVYTPESPMGVTRSARNALCHPAGADFFNMRRFCGHDVCALTHMVATATGIVSAIWKSELHTRTKVTVLPGGYLAPILNRNDKYGDWENSIDPVCEQNTLNSSNIH